MSTYSVSDIACSFSGDITIGSHGDLSLADSYETHKAAVNFLIRTDKGQYKPDKRVGCNLGSFIGDQMLPETFQGMEQTALDNLTKFVMSPTDVQVHVMPLSKEEAGVFVLVAGDYIDSNGNVLVTSAPEVIAYSYPYAEGQPTLINVQ